MDINILEDKKNRLVFEIDGESNTITGALKSELRNDDHVKATGYNHAHPLLNKATVVVETDTIEEPRKAVSQAVKRLSKQVDKLKDGAKTLK